MLNRIGKPVNVLFETKYHVYATTILFSRFHVEWNSLIYNKNQHLQSSSSIRCVYCAKGLTFYVDKLCIRNSRRVADEEITYPSFRPNENKNNNNNVYREKMNPLFDLNQSIDTRNRHSCRYCRATVKSTLPALKTSRTEMPFYFIYGRTVQDFNEPQL